MKVLQTQKKERKKKGSITHDAAIDALDFVAIDAVKNKNGCDSIRWPWDTYVYYTIILLQLSHDKSGEWS